MLRFRRGEATGMPMNWICDMREGPEECKGLEIGKLWVEQVWGGRSKIQFWTRSTSYCLETILHGSLMFLHIL